YHVIFDASHNGSSLSIYWLGPIAALIAVLIGKALVSSSETREVSKGKLFLVVASIGFCFLLLLFGGNYTLFYKTNRALLTGDYQSVEGTVQDFVPMPPGGHSIESFEVNKISFRYGSGVGSVMFNSEWNRGSIHNGVQVRIAYSGEDILRVEVR